MPYISPTRRLRYDDYENLQLPENGGDLSYVISRLIARYTEGHELRYDTIAEVRSALVGALGEYDRVVADPYEDRKRKDNGDIWGTLTQ